MPYCRARAMGEDGATAGAIDHRPSPPDTHLIGTFGKTAIAVPRVRLATKGRQDHGVVAALLSAAHSLAACSLSSRQPQKPRSGVLPSLPRQSIEAPRRSGRASGALLPVDCREGFE